MEFYSISKKELQLDNNLSLKGFSRGGLRTGLILLPYKIFLDAGIPHQIEPNLILITHGHQDHVDALYSNLMDNKDKPKVIASANLIPHLQNYLNSCRSMNVGKKMLFTNWIPYEISNSNRTYEIIISNKKFLFESFYLDHTVESIGYGISEIRRKLLDIYKNKTKDEIIKLKKINEITENKKVPLLFFSGDTSSSILNTLPFYEYPNFIIEATFLDDEDIDETLEKKHLHIKNLEPYFLQYPNTKFILIHFSSKYKLDEIKKYQKKYLEYKNVEFFI
jgi:ribonuclease BN (tRNA processing enzyme)